MNIDIPESLATALQAKAMAEGVSASTYARRVLERDLSGRAGELHSLPEAGSDLTTSGVDKARAFVLWAKSHRDTPPLSDEAISRASMYPDRW